MMKDTNKQTLPHDATAPTNTPHIAKTLTKAQTQKNALRLAPCPGYDIEGLENWLGDMAREGLFLKKHGVHLGLFCFAKGVPQQMTYRLEATKNPGLFSDGDNMPTEDVIALYDALGWRYIAPYQDFDIFSSVDAPIRELNTDPTLHAQTLSTLKKQLILSFIFITALPFASLIAIYQTDLLQYALHGDTFFFCAWGLLMLHLSFCNITEIIHLTKLRQAIKNEGELDHKKDWKANQTKHYLHISIGWVLLIAFIGSYVLVCI